MEEQTIPEEPVVDAPAPDQGLPEVTTDDTAVQTTEPSEEATTQEAVIDDDIKAWAATKGISVESENEIKLAQIARDNQRDFTKKRQETSQLDKSLETKPQQLQQAQPGANDEMTEFIKDYKRDKAINQFKESNPDWQDHETKMVELLSEPIETSYGTFPRSELVNAGLIGLNDVLTMARGSNTDSIKEDGGREALEQLAAKQRAATPSGNASIPGGSSQRITSANVEQVYANATPEQLKDPTFQQKISEAMQKL